MARGGMRVLCLEKNHFIGGMATTTELVRGYRFELAGSVQFPVPTEIYDDLDFGACPIFEPEVQSVSHRPVGRAADPALQQPRPAVRAPERAHWASTPCSAWRRSPPGPRPRPGPSGASTCGRRPSRSTRCSPAPPTRRSARPSAPRCSAVSWTSSTGTCPTAGAHAQVRGMLAFLAVNSTYRALLRGQRAVPGVRPGLPGRRHHVQGARAGSAPSPTTSPASSRRPAANCGATSRCAGIAVEAGRVTGVVLGDGERSAHRSWCRTSTRPPPSPTWSTGTALPDEFTRRVDAIDHRALYFQMHFALSGCRSTPAPTRS